MWGNGVRDPQPPPEKNHHPTNKTVFFLNDSNFVNDFKKWPPLRKLKNIAPGVREHVSLGHPLACFNIDKIITKFENYQKVQFKQTISINI